MNKKYHLLVTVLKYIYCGRYKSSFISFRQFMTPSLSAGKHFLDTWPVLCYLHERFSFILVSIISIFVFSFYLKLHLHSLLNNVGMIG